MFLCFFVFVLFLMVVRCVFFWCMVVFERVCLFVCVSICLFCVLVVEVGVF